MFKCAAVCVVALFFLSNCSKKKDAAGDGDSAPSSQASLVRRGKTVYFTKCTVCHNSDPKRAGPVGPEIFGSSLELIKLKVLEKKYPAGHTPIRTTTLMIAMPELEKDIPALHAFLNN